MCFPCSFVYSDLLICKWLIKRKAQYIYKYIQIWSLPHCCLNFLFMSDADFYDDRNSVENTPWFLDVQIQRNHGTSLQENDAKCLRRKWPHWLRYILHNCSLHFRLCRNSSPLLFFLWLSWLCHSLPQLMKIVGTRSHSAALLLLYRQTNWM